MANGKPFDGPLPIVYGTVRVDGHPVFLGKRGERGHVWKYTSASNRAGLGGFTWDPGANVRDYRADNGSTTSLAYLLRVDSYTKDYIPWSYTNTRPYVYFRTLDQVRTVSNPGPRVSLDFVSFSPTASSAPTYGSIMTLAQPSEGPHVAAAYVICESPVVSVPRVFREGVAIPSASAMYLCTLQTSSFEFVTGSAPTWAGFAGTSASAMTMTGTVQFRALALALADGKLPALAFEVSGAHTHPADVVTNLLTDPRHGLGFSTASVVVGTGSDGATASSYRSYCDAVGFTRVSRAIDQQTRASEVLDELMHDTNSVVVWSEGRIRIVPMGDAATGSFVPPSTGIALGPDDLLFDAGGNPITVVRVPDSEVFNTWPVAFTDRNADYSEVTVEYIEPAHSALYGVRRASKTNCNWVDNAAHALRLSTILAQKSINLRNRYRFRLGPRWALLEPADLVTLTEPVLGLVSASCRIVAIDEDEQGVLDVEAVQWDAGTVTPVNVAAQAYEGFAAGMFPVAAGAAASEAQSAASGAANSDLSNVVTGSVSSLTLDAPSRHDYSTLWGNPTSELSPELTELSASPDYANRVNIGTKAFNGSWVRQVSASAATVVSMSSYDIPCIPGETYSLSVRTRLSASGGGAYVLLQALDATGSVVSSISSSMNTGVAWVTSKATPLLVPTGSTSVRGNMVASASVAWFDGIAFARTGDADALGATGSPTYVYGFGIGAGTVVVTTAATSVTGSGGSPSYTYSWTYVSGETATVNSPTSANTTFTRSKTGGSGLYTGVYKGKVTDADGNIAYGPNVTVETEHEI